MDSELPVTTTLLDEVLLVTLNRPAKANARNQSMQSALLAAFAEAEQRRDIHAVVLTGAGARTFSGGMDLGELQLTHGFGKARIESDFALYDAMESCPKPVVAAVNGAAAGGGLDLVLASDLAVAERHATFACPEAKLGLVPLFALLRLPSVVGPQRAATMLLGGRVVTASEAAGWGLVGEVVGTGASAGRALTLAKELSGVDENVVKVIKAGLKGKAESMARDHIADLVVQLFDGQTLAANLSRFQYAGSR